MIPEPCPALLQLKPSGARLFLHLGGHWTLKASCIPTLAEVTLALEQHPEVQEIVVDGGEIETWDSRLLLFLYDLVHTFEEHVEIRWQNLPKGAMRLLELALSARRREHARAEAPRPLSLASLGEAVLKFSAEAHRFLEFLGEVVLALGRFLKGQAYVRWRDVWWLLEGCGPRALPIVTLIALLVGMIIAYVGALQLQMFGAQIFVADLVAIGMVREMGAMMTAVIVAGRTGAAYAAQLGTMQVSEEIDAFKTFAISPIEALVLPRLVALVLMVPLLAIYADVVGILGGGIAATAVFDLSWMEYFYEMQRMLTPSDVLVGLTKAALFGLWIALAGCFRGLLCGRSAEAVGEATTSSVVTSIVGIVVADALLTILLTHLGI